MARTLRITFALLLTLALIGCATAKQAFPTATADEVWQAMKAVAETPEYREWTVQDNQVWVDEAVRHVEVRRELARHVRQAPTPPRTERRTVHFEAVLEKTDPPTVAYFEKSAALPLDAKDDANQFFTEIYVILTGLPVDEK